MKLFIVVHTPALKLTVHEIFKLCLPGTVMEAVYFTSLSILKNFTISSKIYDTFIVYYAKFALRAVILNETPEKFIKYTKDDGTFDWSRNIVGSVL